MENNTKRRIIIIMVSTLLSLGPILIVLGAFSLIKLETAFLIFTIYGGIGTITYWFFVILSLAKKEPVDQWFNLFIVTAVFLMLLFYLIGNWGTI